MVFDFCRKFGGSRILMSPYDSHKPRPHALGTRLDPHLYVTHFTHACIEGVSIGSKVVAPTKNTGRPKKLCPVCVASVEEL